MYYESDFGIVNFQVHRMMPDDRIDVLEKQYFKIAYLKPFQTDDLPKNSLKIAKIIKGQLTLEVRTKDAHAAITHIKTA